MEQGCCLKGAFHRGYLATHASCINLHALNYGLKALNMSWRSGTTSMRTPHPSTGSIRFGSSGSSVFVFSGSCDTARWTSRPASHRSVTSSSFVSARSTASTPVRHVFYSPDSPLYGPTQYMPSPTQYLYRAVDVHIDRLYLAYVMASARWHQALLQMTPGNRRRQLARLQSLYGVPFAGVGLMERELWRRMLSDD